METTMSSYRTTTITVFIVFAGLMGLALLPGLSIPLIGKLVAVLLSVVLVAHAALSLWQGTNLATDLIDYEPVQAGRTE
ncbi:hypothetical protein [Spirosoma lacussanchae]|uniref:hypothetical protein n=2 Tax=Spirosoma lacussanchae TaxID=1884249 RepID=UPI00110902FE